MLVQAVSGPPAMRRVWTAFPGNDPKVVGARGEAVFYTSRSQIGALDKRTGRTLWSIPRFGRAVLTGSRLVVQFGSAEHDELASLDLRTGAVLDRILPAGKLITFIGQGDRVYLLLDGMRVAAYDETLTRRKWSQEFTSKAMFGNGYLLADDQTVLASVDQRGIFALNAETGRPQWMAESKYPGYTLLAEGQVAFNREQTSEVRDARTGRVLWKTSSLWPFLGVRNGVAFAERNALIQGYDWRTGALLWDRPGGTNVNVGWPRTYPAMDGDGLWIRSDRLRSFTAEGTERWAMDIDLPAYADADLWVTQEENRILGYRAGRRPEIPSSEEEGETLAQELVRNYEVLDGYERNLLVNLAPHGGEALLARVPAWAAELEKGSSQAPMLTEMLYRLEERLFDGFRPEQTDALLRTIEKVPRSERYRYLDRLMLAKGDPSRPIPGLLRRLRAGDEETIVKIAARSTDPASVNFVLKRLLDPQAGRRFRQEAYIGLASTAGAKGRAAILRVRPTQAKKTPWLKVPFAPVGYAMHPYPQVLTDAKGREWALAPSLALGNPGGLFLAPRRGAGWGRPLYTGVIAPYGDFGSASPGFGKTPLKKFLAGAWIKVLPTDRSIRADRDGDGLTDLVETALGLNPLARDTDGDGVSDGIDLCPNAKPRPLGDREKIIRAVVDAYYFAQPRTGPIVMAAPPGIAPFEIYGAGAPLLWLPFETRLFSEYYGPPRLFFFNRDLNGRDPEWLKLSSDGQRATTYLGTGHYEGSRTARVTLEKHGTEWFVTEMLPSYSYSRKPP